MPRFALAALAAVLLGPLAACDLADQDRAPSSFEATVSGARTATLVGQAGTSYQEEGIPTLWVMLTHDDPNTGGISFSRAYELDLRPGTFAIGPDEALDGGFHAFLTLPAEADSAVTYWAFDGTLTVASVEDGLAEGTFTFRAGPAPSATEPEVQAEGTFRAVVNERD